MQLVLLGWVGPAPSTDSYSTKNPLVRSICIIPSYIDRSIDEKKAKPTFCNIRGTSVILAWGHKVTLCIIMWELFNDTGKKGKMLRILYSTWVWIHTYLNIHLRTKAWIHAENSACQTTFPNDSTHSSCNAKKPCRNSRNNWNLMSQKRWRNQLISSTHPRLQIHPARTPLHPSPGPCTPFSGALLHLLRAELQTDCQHPRRGRLPTSIYCNLLNGLFGKMKMETVYEQHYNVPLRKARSVKLHIKQKSELKI